MATKKDRQLVYDMGAQGKVTNEEWNKEIRDDIINYRHSSGRLEWLMKKSRAKTGDPAIDLTYALNLAILLGDRKKTIKIIRKEMKYRAKVEAAKRKKNQ